MAQFILALLVGLALLTWAASGVVQTTAREWFERDVSSRGELVLTGARQSLSSAWYGDPKDLQKQLADLARDEPRHGCGDMRHGFETARQYPRISR